MPGTIIGLPPGVLPGSTKGFVAVSKDWAAQHPEAVVKVGDNYYRAAAAAGDDSYLSAGDQARMMLERIKTGEMEFRGPEGWVPTKDEKPEPSETDIWQEGAQQLTKAQRRGIALSKSGPSETDMWQEGAQQLTKAQILGSTIELADGSRITRSSLDKLPKAYQDIGLAEGYKPMVKAIESGGIIKEGQLVAQAVRIPGMEPVGIIREIKPVKAEALKKQEDIYTWRLNGKKISDQERDKLISDYEAKRDRLIREGKMFTNEWFELGPNPKDEIVRSPEASAKVLKNTFIFAAELIVPGLYVARHWNELSSWEKGIWLAVDVLSVLPLAGAAVRGSRSVGVAGKTARAGAAASEAGREVVAIARAPVDMIIHPVGTVKYTGRQLRTLIENIAHPRKLPEAVITTASGTVRLKVGETTSAKEAMRIRDQLVKLAARGERPIVEIGDLRVELARSPLMREAGGGLVHTSPMGERLETATKVKPKAGAPASEQGLFLSPEPTPRFATTSAFGKTGERPVFVITSRETAERAITSGKIYKSPLAGDVAEMEARFRVGETLPEVKQKLLTRVGPLSQKVEIWLEKPLSARQIAKLKAEGLVEWIKAPFKEPIRVRTRRAAGLTTSQTDDLAKVLKASGNTRQAENLLRAERIAQYARRVPPTLTRSGKLSRPPGERLSRVEDVARTARASRVERFEAATRTARVERPAREDERLPKKDDIPERLERPSRVEERMPGRTAREERTDRVERTTSTDRVPRTDRVDRVERPPRTERPTRTARPPREERPPRTPRIPRVERGEGSLPPPPGDKERREAFTGAIAWKQGFGWWAVKEPYSSNNDVAFFFDDPPPGAKRVKGGLKSAMRSIQALTGKSPKKLTIDMGIMDVTINKPVASPGRPGAIKFARDPGAKTRSRITLGGSQRIKKEGPYYRIPGSGLSRNRPRGRLLS